MQSLVQTVYHSSEILTKKTHFHDCHQIILILNGKVEFCVNGSYIKAGAGDVAVFSRYENHSVAVSSKEYERYVLHVDPTVVNRESPVYSLLTDRPTGFCNVINVLPYMEDITYVFKRLLLERASRNQLADEMEQLAVKQLLIMIYRCMPVSFEGAYDDVVMQLKRQFENYYKKQYTLSMLAKQHNVSESSLSHRFSEATGMSVMEYLLSCRMATAKRMLAVTDMPVGEIVEACGFSDNINFSRTFKRLNGISPSDFRKKYNSKSS